MILSSHNSSQLLQNTVKFPLYLFPDYLVHHHDTDCAILYHRTLAPNVTTLERSHLPQNKAERLRTLQYCSINVEFSEECSVTFTSFYRTKNANASDIFAIPFSNCTSVFCGGDFNLKHPRWGSDLDLVSPEAENF